MLPAASATTETGERTVAPAALPPSPKLLVAEPATVEIVYVGWADSMPANPVIKNVVTSDLFTKVSLIRYRSKHGEYGRL
jgi:hypothetical protein